MPKTLSVSDNIKITIVMICIFFIVLNLLYWGVLALLGFIPNIRILIFNELLLFFISLLVGKMGFVANLPTEAEVNNKHKD